MISWENIKRQVPEHILQAYCHYVNDVECRPELEAVIPEMFSLKNQLPQYFKPNHTTAFRGISAERGNQFGDYDMFIETCKRVTFSPMNGYFISNEQITYHSKETFESWSAKFEVAKLFASDTPNGQWLGVILKAEVNDTFLFNTDFSNAVSKEVSTWFVGGGGTSDWLKKGEFEMINYGATKVNIILSQRSMAYINSLKGNNLVEKILKEATTVYHGTDSSFDKFDISQSKAMGKFGIWFTEDKSFAEMFGMNVKTANIDLKKPFVITGKKWNDIRGKHAKDAEWFANWKQQLISKGHDGLKVLGSQEKFAGTLVNNPTIYAVFDTKNIIQETALKEAVTNYDKLYALAKSNSFDTFLDKTDGLHYDMLYRGGALNDRCFMTDYVGHARDYSEDEVDGILYNPSDVLWMDNATFDALRKQFSGIGINELNKIYAYDFKHHKLIDAMEGKQGTEKGVLNFVYRFLKSDIPYESVQQNKYKNDLLIPIMLYYAQTKNKNIISFVGGDYADYGGQNEFVVNDISRYTKLSDVWKKANSVLQEARVINPAYDAKETPLKDGERIRVYHAVNQEIYALSMIQNGFSGQEYARRIYSYEHGNNPKGVFVSVDFKLVAKNFASSGIIIEFDANTNELEAPVWKGQDSYFVQGQYTQSFSSDEERQAEMLRKREMHKNHPDEKIAKSDRPELAQSVFENYEKQALFVGHCNPERIKAVWVHEQLFYNRMTSGDWKRISKKQFMQDFGKQIKDKHDKLEYRSRGLYNQDYDERAGRIFKPDEDFSFKKVIDYLKNKWKSKSIEIDKHLMYAVRDSDSQKRLMWPKQIEQVNKIVPKEFTYSTYTEYTAWRNANK
jgi:hypothetical protein